MAYRQAVHLRTTHHYDDARSDLDGWREAGVVKLLPARQVRAPRDISDSGVYLMHAVAHRPPASKRSARLLGRAIADTLTISGCRHEHDCCGCVMQSARVVHSSGRRYVVRLTRTRNY